MYKLDLPIDLKEATAIENRRNREEQRKSRIFNSKNRQIGINKHALEQQINEKKLKERSENDSDNLYAASAIRSDKIAILMDKRQQEDLKELHRILNEFNLSHLKTDQRREFDLYDPDALKKDKPARVCDDDPRCGISSIQKFDGEDLNNKNRISAQKDQMKYWLELQMIEKNNVAKLHQKSQRIYDLKQIELDNRTCNLMSAEEECRRALNIALSNYNEAISQENIEKQRLKIQQDEDDKRMHIINALMSDLLTENPNQSQSALGQQRIIPDRYKGMSKEQLQQIYDKQNAQINEKKLKLQQEKEVNQLTDKQIMTHARSGLLIENEMLRRKQILNRTYADENIQLSKNHKEIMDHINNEIYTNEPTAAYFMQFNTCSR